MKKIWKTLQKKQTRSSETKHNSAIGTHKKATEQPAAPKSAIVNNEEKESLIKESAEQTQRGVMSEKSDVSTADLESLADASKKTRVKFETLGHVTQVGVGISHTS